MAACRQLGGLRAAPSICSSYMELLDGASPAPLPPRGSVPMLLLLAKCLVAFLCLLTEGESACFSLAERRIKGSSWQGARAQLGRTCEPFVLLETSSPSLVSEVLVHIPVFPQDVQNCRLCLCPWGSRAAVPARPFPRSPRWDTWDTGRPFPGPGLPAAAAALRGGPSRSRRAP